MATLKSILFTLQTGPETVQMLENCANGHPSQAASHFRLGHSGEAIRMLQLAVGTAQDRFPELAIPDFDFNEVYDQKFADAVMQYKRARDIRNHLGQIDNIIGRKTISNLDRDMLIACRRGRHLMSALIPTTDGRPGR
jgi:hypothetical protein